MDVPKPDYILGISGRLQENGDCYRGHSDKRKARLDFVYGDTNLTLAGALVAAKIHIPNCHVEAGTRTHCDINPEEINRICVGHVSKKLLAFIESSVKEMENEGLVHKVTLLGNLMFDAFVEYSTKLSIKEIELTLLNEERTGIPKEYYYLTCHREENTKKEEAFLETFKGMNLFDALTLYQVMQEIKKGH